MVNSLEQIRDPNFFQHIARERHCRSQKYRREGIYDEWRNGDLDCPHTVKQAVPFDVLWSTEHYKMTSHAAVRSESSPSFPVSCFLFSLSFSRSSFLLIFSHNNIFRQRFHETPMVYIHFVNYDLLYTAPFIPFCFFSLVLFYFLPAPPLSSLFFLHPFLFHSVQLDAVTVAVAPAASFSSPAPFP